MSDTIIATIKNISPISASTFYEGGATLSGLVDVDLQGVSDGSLLVYDTNGFVARTLSGDAIISADGVVTINPNVVYGQLPQSISTTSSPTFNNITLNGIINNSDLSLQLESKAPKHNPTFSGIVSGITSTMVGLGDVNNTGDANKPVSIATQAALNTKQPLDADLTAYAADPTTSILANMPDALSGLGEPYDGEPDSLALLSVVTESLADTTCPTLFLTTPFNGRERFKSQGATAGFVSAGWFLLWNGTQWQLTYYGAGNTFYNVVSTNASNDPVNAVWGIPTVGTGTPIFERVTGYPPNPLPSYIGQLYNQTSSGLWYRWNGTGWDADTFTAGTGIDITDNVISATVIIPSKLINGINEVELGDDANLYLAQGGGIIFDRNNTSINVGMGFHIRSGEGVAIEPVDQADSENLITRGWYFNPDGSLTAPNDDYYYSRSYIFLNNFPAEDAGFGLTTPDGITHDFFYDYDGIVGAGIPILVNPSTDTIEDVATKTIAVLNNSALFGDVHWDAELNYIWVYQNVAGEAGDQTNFNYGYTDGISSFTGGQSSKIVFGDGSIQTTAPTANAISSSIPIGVTGASQVSNIITITQDGYNAIANPSSDILYVIVG